MVGALTLLCPARGGARQACGVYFTLYSSVVTDSPAIDCDTAETHAVNKAKLDVMNQGAIYVCPAACPNLTVVTAPHVTCVDCVPNGTRWDGRADAEGTYKCD
jgi:hypothetical protein